MSVIVKGMKMPECCDVCMFSDWSNLRQTASCKLKEYEPCFADFSNEYRSKRADFCPLIALQDKHGRLGDLDALVIDLMDRGLEGIQTDDWAEIQQTVMEQPTIVDKEDSE